MKGPTPSAPERAAQEADERRFAIPRWTPDRAWTGAWGIPRALDREQSAPERRALVALCAAGYGPARLAKALSRVDSALELGDGHPVPALPEDARVVLPCDEEYPACLREIAGPPLVLFVRGLCLSELSPCVAIVGARICTKGAERFAERLGETIAATGFTVVSGLARGTDGAAHRGALEAGRTAAVLGTGIDVVYPIEHKTLAGRIVCSGVLVTEFGPQVTPERWHFPARNRIIAGLSIAVIVVEAGVRSGALITADFAVDQGREVFACTVGPENPQGAGVREMLRDGARLVVDPDDTAAELVELASNQGFDLTPPDRRARVMAEVGGEAGLVLDAIVEETSIDEIVERTALGPGRVASLLGALELDGLVSDDGGGRWRRSIDLRL